MTCDRLLTVSAGQQIEFTLLEETRRDILSSSGYAEEMKTPEGLMKDPF